MSRSGEKNVTFEQSSHFGLFVLINQRKDTNYTKHFFFRVHSFLKTDLLNDKNTNYEVKEITFYFQ